MKGFAFILAFIIFSISLKATAFVHGLVGAMQGEVTAHSCCKTVDDSDVKSCDESDEKEEKAGCCDGDDCQCTCCLHIVYLQQLSNSSFAQSDFKDVKFGYSFLYQADYLKSVFHPPAIV